MSAPIADNRPSILFAMRYPDSIGYVWNTVAAVRDAMAAELGHRWQCWLAYPQLTGTPAFQPQHLKPVALDLYSRGPEALRQLTAFAQTNRVQAIVYMSALPSTLDLRRIHALGVKTLNTEEDSFDHRRRNPAWLWLLKTLQRRVLRQGLHHLHIANAQSQGDWLMDFARIPRSRLAVVPNGIDTERFRPAADATERAAAERLTGMRADHLWVLCAGQSRSEKRIPDIVQVASRLLADEAALPQPVSFAYVGDGPEFERIRSAVQAAGLGDRFLLAGGRNNLVPYYRCASVFVHAAERESFGLVLAEAMACGLPVVACAAAGPQELVVPGQTGFLVPIEEPAALGKPLLNLLTNPALRQEMGHKSRRRAACTYDRRTQVHALAKCVERVIDEP